MDGQGISGAYGGGDRVVHIGRNVCSDLEAGTPSGQIVAKVQQGNPSLTPGQAQLIVDTAHRYFCPQA